jgi:hypothetical protein
MVTATPSGANSVARASENPSMANFVEPQPGVPTNPPIEEMLTIRPDRWARSVGNTARMTLRAPKTFVS